MLDYRSYQVAPHGDREIRGTREFNAPRALVWKAYTEPELLRRWLLGPDGWEMTVCRVDLRVGGTYRYEWHKAKENLTMGMGGAFLEIDAPRKLVSNEKFDESWYPGGMTATVEFTEQGDKTLIRQAFVYDSREGRDAVLKSRMDEGMVAGYNRLDDVLASLLAAAPGRKSAAS